MRLEAWSARTWVLAVFAGWAVLVVLLAVFGLGGRITPLPVDPELTQPLPRLPAAPPERLGPVAQYGEVGGRPLFAENRRPQPFFISGEEAAAPAFDLVLSSVLITPALKLAIVQPAQGGEGLRVKLGESPTGFAGWRLVELEPRRAVFEGAEGRRELALRVFDGASGQPPTPMVVNRPPGSPAPMPVVPPASVPQGRTTGGNNAPMATPTVPSPAPPPVPPTQPPASSNAPSNAAASEPAMSTEQQMEAIRQRIEQRRAQLRQQQANPNTPPAPPGKTQ